MASIVPGSAGKSRVFSRTHRATKQSVHHLDDHLFTISLEKLRARLGEQSVEFVLEAWIVSDVLARYISGHTPRRHLEGFLQRRDPIPRVRVARLWRKQVHD